MLTKSRVGLTWWRT